MTIELRNPPRFPRNNHDRPFAFFRRYPSKWHPFSLLIGFYIERAGAFPPPPEFEGWWFFDAPDPAVMEPTTTFAAVPGENELDDGFVLLYPDLSPSAQLRDNLGLIMPFNVQLGTRGDLRYSVAYLGWDGSSDPMQERWEYGGRWFDQNGPTLLDNGVLVQTNTITGQSAGAGNINTRFRCFADERDGRSTPGSDCNAG